MLAFGQPVNTYYDLAKANVVVSLDSDFLASGAGSLRYARQFASRRRVADGKTDDESAVRGRAYAHAHGREGRPPAAAARRRYRRVRLGIGRRQRSGAGPERAKTATSINGPALSRSDLLRNKGASLVIAGEYQPPMVHALAHVMNDSLGNVGKTVFYTDPIEANPVDQIGFACRTW